MKQLKLFISAGFVITLLSCNNKQSALNINPSKAVEQEHKNNPVKETPALNNPALMNGSSFGNYFQSLYKLGRFDDLMKFTSSKTIKEFGTEKIIESYRKMDFAYTIELKSKQENTDGTITLNYLSQQFATRRMVRITVTIENDTVKLIGGEFVRFK